jgi:hypothetical protein
MPTPIVNDRQATVRTVARYDKEYMQNEIIFNSFFYYRQIV